MTSARGKVVVITGGAKGIGLGLAREFLNRGAEVWITSRSKDGLDKGLADLGNPRELHGLVCDVGDLAQVQNLWTQAKAQSGRVDIWINNAGLGQPQSDLDLLDPTLLAAIISTNVTGALYGAHTALAGMKTQGYGAIYNVEGLGSQGGLVKGMTVYAASKRALAYITDSLALETRGSKILVGSILPGMTVTDLIIQEYRGRPEEWKKVAGIFNILSDTVETLAPWLVEKMLGNKRNGARFNWLNTGKVLLRFLSALFVKRRVYPEDLA